MLDSIRTLAKDLLTESLTPGQEALFDRLCQLALRYWRDRVNPDLEEASFENELMLATVFLALAYFRDGKSATDDPIQSFSAGDFSVHFDKSADHNPAFARALDIIKPFLAPPNALFRGVRG